MSRFRQRSILLGLTAGIAVVLLVSVFALDGHAHARQQAARTGRRATSRKLDGSRGRASRRARDVSAVQAGQPAAARKLTDPLTTTPVRRLVGSRRGSVSVAVDDLRTGQEWLLHPRARDQTASIIKVDILETLLYRAMKTRTPLDQETADLAQTMIENSSDSAATTLWDDVGGSSGVGRYNARAGLTQTRLNTDGYWGESLTSAADQIRLLRELEERHSLLDSRSRRYELHLMESVEADQDWGVSAGVPAGVSIALKNGWVPLINYSDWEINSIGRIKGDGRDYLVAVLTAHDPSEAYGITTIGRISKLVWRELAPAS